MPPVPTMASGGFSFQLRSPRLIRSQNADVSSAQKGGMGRAPSCGRPPFTSTRRCGVFRSWTQWLRGTSMASKSRRGTRRCRLQLECLEDRCLPSHLYTVTSAADDPSVPIPGVVTLRDAIIAVNSDTTDGATAPTLSNSPSRAPRPSTCSRTCRRLTNPVLIDGTTQAGVTIDGQASAGANSYRGWEVLVVGSAATWSRM